MDFPIFHLDFLGNRALIAIIAVLHAVINHALAVGLMPVVAMLEFKGFSLLKTDPAQAEKWDKTAYRILFFAFLITTTIGAMTGVGIWFSASLVNPASIGSLIRVFFGAWFVEWIVFVTEVVLILLYFLTWKKLRSTITDRAKHLRYGIFLSFFSWITMSIIVSILSFMMDTGNWNANRSFIYGFLNPIYVPQLLFRTTLAMTMGGMIALFLAIIFTRKDPAFRAVIVRFISRWVLVWAPLAALGAALYYYVIPDNLIGNLPVAMGTMEFQNWYSQIISIVGIAIGLVMITANWSFFKPATVPSWLAGLSILLVVVLMGHFERLREFIRKPYVIGEYMYSNGIRVEDYPLLQRDGVLKHANFVPTKQITAGNITEAGRDVFIITCSRCHTTNGMVNPIKGKFTAMFGNKPWDTAQMKAYIKNMHRARYFMPPFPGNNQELEALCVFIKTLQQDYTLPVEGSQNGLGLLKPSEVSAGQ
ncbi:MULTISPECIES: cytochrome c [Emticicia]|uniref:c-type cytochrome n=1 Tax=Emticicia TaxID=312278 RepID=UPI00209DE785|nr:MULTISPECIES: cytochrome c [Emticicia]UTA66464.1 cytochrome c [Emticicia sp. 21SJ11W-3]